MDAIRITCSFPRAEERRPCAHNGARMLLATKVVFDQDDEIQKESPDCSEIPSTCSFKWSLPISGANSQLAPGKDRDSDNLRTESNQMLIPCSQAVPSFVQAISQARWNMLTCPHSCAKDNQDP